MKIYACDEHIDIALEDAIDKLDDAPVLNKIEEHNGVSTGCEYCKSSAIYMVTN